MKSRYPEKTFFRHAGLFIVFPNVLIVYLSFYFIKIEKRKDGKPVNYNLRFHLYPGLTAVKTMSGNSALIQISKNKSLIFTIDDENLVFRTIASDTQQAYTLAKYLISSFKLNLGTP